MPQTWKKRQKQRKQEDTIDKHIPLYLKRFIVPHHGDFCHTPIFHERLVAQCMSEGFLPIATQGYLLPKLHRERCVIALPHHISKSTRKKSKRFDLTVNKDFMGVVQGCHEQHGSTCWLYPPLVSAFHEIHKGGMETQIFHEKTGNAIPNRKCIVRLYSIELYCGEDLVAGELGYTVGDIYTSLTGFSRQDSAGSVQLAALGALLVASNFRLWDLGMDMEYKQNLGSSLMPRNEFRKQVLAGRETLSHLVLKSDRKTCAKTIIDQSTSLATTDSNVVETKTNSIVTTPSVNTAAPPVGSPKRYSGEGKATERRKKQRVATASQRSL